MVNSRDVEKERPLDATSKSHTLLAGAGALSAANFVRLGVQLISIPVLARLLGPYPVGLMAMVMPIVMLATLFCDLGFSSVLMRERTIEAETTAFWISTTASLFLSAALICSAGGISGIIHPDIEPVLLALAVILPATAFMAVPIARLTRDGRLGMFALADVLSVFLGLAIGIYGALSGWGVWSLVAQQVLVAFTRLWVLATAARFYPRWEFKFTAAKRLLRASAEFTAFNFLSVTSKNADNLLVGYLLGARPAGGYAMSYQLVRMPDLLLSGPLYMAVASALSSDALCHVAARRLYLICAGLLSTIVVPSMVGLALLAQPVVGALLGPQWIGTAPVLSSLSLAGLFQALNILNLAFLTGLGEYRVQRRIGLLMAVGTGVGVIAGAPWGAAGVGWGVSVGSFLAFGMASLAVGRRIGLGAAIAFTGLARTALPTGLMAVAILYTLGAAPPFQQPIYQLPLPIAVGAVAYSCAYALFWRRSLLKDLTELRTIIAKPVAVSNSSSGT